MDGETEVKTTENNIEETTKSESETDGAAESQGLSDEAAKRLAHSKEMREFYRTLVALQTGVILHLQRAKNEEDMKKRLIEETTRLDRLVEFYAADKCDPPLVWDSVLWRCV